MAQASRFKTLPHTAVNLQISYDFQTRRLFRLDENYVSQTRQPILRSGAAYVYQSKDGKWTQIAELPASDGVAVGEFGGGVAVRNNTLLVGAAGQHPQIDNGQSYPGGEAYVYRLN